MIHLIHKNINCATTYSYLKEIIDMYCTAQKIKIPDQVKNTLLFFMLYGINSDTYDKILANKIATSKGIINVYKTKLAGFDLIYKKKQKIWLVTDDLLIKNSSIKFEINISKLKNVN